MTHAHQEPAPEGQDGFGEEDATATDDLPIDPDITDVPAAPPEPVRSTTGPFGRARPARWPQLRPSVLAVVFVGGCAGGAARYAITTDWPGRTTQFPWPTFAVNTFGAFLLALIVVIAADVLPRRYLRPLLGTGFCGAFTTFSSVVVSADQLLAHHHAGVAAGYLASTVVAGLAAASFGLITGRAIAASRRAGHSARRPEQLASRAERRPR